MEPSALTVSKNATARRAGAILKQAFAMKETVHLDGQDQIVSDLVMMASMDNSALRSVDFAKEGNPVIK